MEKIYQNLINSLVESEKLHLSSDHLVYVTYPVVKDPKLLVRALETLHKSLVLTITTILKFEYLFKRIDLTKNTALNLKIFFNKCSKRYSLDQKSKEILKEILRLRKIHKESPIEFSKSEKFIILDDKMEKQILDLEKMKLFLKENKELLKTANSKFREIF